MILVSRNAYKKREFELDVKYFGNKGLYEFRKTEEPRKKLQMCLAARGQVKKDQGFDRNPRDSADLLLASVNCFNWSSLISTRFVNKPLILCVR